MQVDDNSAMSRAGMKAGEAIFPVDKQSVSKLTEKRFYERLDTRTGERVFPVGDAKGEKRRDVRVLPITL